MNDYHRLSGAAPPAIDVDSFSSGFALHDFIERLTNSALPPEYRRPDRSSAAGVGTSTGTDNATNTNSNSNSNPSGPAASSSTGPAAARPGSHLLPEREDTTFNPAPLVDSFTATLGQLRSLAARVSSEQADLVSNVRAAERKHRRVVADLKHGLLQSVQKYAELERDLNPATGEFRKIAESLTLSRSALPDQLPAGPDQEPAPAPAPPSQDGGHLAVRIGKKMEEIAAQRQRALDAKFIIQCWIQLSTLGKLSLLEDSRRLGRNEEKLRCAHIARQLLKISLLVKKRSAAQAADGAPPDAPDRRKSVPAGPAAKPALDPDAPASPDQRTAPDPQEIIEKFLLDLENDLLKQFQHGMDRKNYTQVYETSKQLREFGHGARIIQQFIADQFSTLERHLAALPFDDTNYWLALSNPNNLAAKEAAGQPANDDSTVSAATTPSGHALERSFKDLLAYYKDAIESKSLLMQKIFPFAQEVLVRFIQQIFQTVMRTQLEAFLRRAKSHSQLAFLRALQVAKGQFSIMVEGLKSHGMVDHPNPASVQVCTTIDQELDDLFIPYLSNNAFVLTEKRSLDQLCTALLFQFSAHHTNRKRGKNYLSFGQKSPVGLYVDSLADLPATQRDALLAVSGLSTALLDPANRVGWEVSDECGEITTETCNRLFHWLAESIGRIIELGSPVDIPQNVKMALGTFRGHICDMYLNTGLESIGESLRTHTPSKGINSFSSFRSIAAASEILCLYQTVIKSSILPLVSSNISVHQELSTATAESAAQLEWQMSNVLHDTLEAVLASTESILQTQKEDDFLELSPTSAAPCENACSFLKRTYNRFQSELHLEGDNLSSLVSELALGLRSQLLAHFQNPKFKISTQGAFAVRQSVRMYQDLVSQWPISPDSEFSKTAGLRVLDEVANVFVLKPDSLWDHFHPAGPAGPERLPLAGNSIARARSPVPQAAVDGRTGPIPQLVLPSARSEGGGGPSFGTLFTVASALSSLRGRISAPETPGLLAPGGQPADPSALHVSQAHPGMMISLSEVAVGRALPLARSPSGASFAEAMAAADAGDAAGRARKKLLPHLMLPPVRRSGAADGAAGGGGTGTGSPWTAPLPQQGGDGGLSFGGLSSPPVRFPGMRPAAAAAPATQATQAGSGDGAGPGGAAAPAAPAGDGAPAWRGIDIKVFLRRRTDASSDEVRRVLSSL